MQEKQRLESECEMTKNEAAIVSLYTGYLIGDFSEMHKYAQEKLGRPIFTHEFANKELFDELRELSKPDFVSIEVTK
jgi:hypothetical protein